MDVASDMANGRAYLLDEQVRLFPGGEVPASFHHAEVGERIADALRPGGLLHGVGGAGAPERVSLFQHGRLFGRGVRSFLIGRHERREVEVYSLQAVGLAGSDLLGDARAEVTALGVPA